MHLVFGAFYPPTDPPRTQAFTFHLCLRLCLALFPVSGHIASITLSGSCQHSSLQPGFALSAEETDSSITVVAPNAFVSKWVRDRYLSTTIRSRQPTFQSHAPFAWPLPALRSMATRKLLNALHRQTIAASITSPVTAGPVPETPLVVTAADSGGSAITGTAARESHNSSFTFDSFVTGKANQLAARAQPQGRRQPG